MTATGAPVIIVDAMVLAIASLGGPDRALADATMIRDRVWSAPRLWRHEFRHVLRLAEASRCTTYDCEFVAVALALNSCLATADLQILREFPGVAASPEVFAAGG